MGTLYRGAGLESKTARKSRVLVPCNYSAVLHRRSHQISSLVRRIEVVQNVVIGRPLVSASDLIAFNKTDWESTERPQTLFTNTRFLPAIMKEAGLVSSISEVRRNQPKLMVNLTKPDCLWLKWVNGFCSLWLEQNKTVLS